MTDNRCSKDAGHNGHCDAPDSTKPAIHRPLPAGWAGPNPATQAPERPKVPVLEPFIPHDFAGPRSEPCIICKLKFRDH